MTPYTKEMQTLNITNAEYARMSWYLSVNFPRSYHIVEMRTDDKVDSRMCRAAWLLNELFCYIYFLNRIERCEQIIATIEFGSLSQEQQTMLVDYGYAYRFTYHNPDPNTFQDMEGVELREQPNLFGSSESRVFWNTYLFPHDANKQPQPLNGMGINKPEIT